MPLLAQFYRQVGYGRNLMPAPVNMRRKEVAVPVLPVQGANHSRVIIVAVAAGNWRVDALTEERGDFAG